MENVDEGPYGRPLRILWVRNGYLLPVVFGGQIRSYHTMRVLAARHHLVPFVYYRSRRRDHPYEARLAAEFPHARVQWARGGPWRETRRKRRFLQGFISRTPAEYAREASPAVRAAIQRVCAQERIDVVVWDFLQATVNLHPSAPIPGVLFEHNIESELATRIAARQRNPVLRTWLRLKAAKLRAFESRVVQRIDHIVASSARDAAAFRAMGAGDRVTAVSTGVDLREFRPAATESDPSLVIFVGAMRYEPNIDAMEFFCREVWPSVRARLPDARFRIVGRTPAPRVLALASPSVEVTGTVDSVVPHRAAAAVEVVPLLAGGGTRLKLYEAMAMGKAIVSTSLGAEGLDYRDGHDIVLADSAQAFADAVVALLNDAPRRAVLGKAAVATAARYDWPVVVAEFEQVLRRVVANRKTAR